MSNFDDEKSKKIEKIIYNLNKRAYTRYTNSKNNKRFITHKIKFEYQKFRNLKILV